MSFEAPRLDDRTFDDLVQEALKRIPLYTPEWTDHNMSDPGVTLIELFAFMTDVMLYRLNRVPERLYIKMMQLLGMQLREPQAAKSRATFWLSAPQPIDIALRQGTEVSTTRTENEEPVIFSTDYDAVIRVAELTHLLTSIRLPDKRTYQSHDVRQAKNGFVGRGFNIFQEKPQPGDAIYFGLKRDMSDHILGIDIVVDRAAGAGIDPTNPPYIWEALSNANPVEWQPCEIDVDGTKAFNVPGLIRLHLPKMVESEIDGHRGYWLRCRLLRVPEGAPQYQESPFFSRVNAESWGITVDITHAQTVKNEIMPTRSDGTPGQKFKLQNTPILPRSKDEYIIVRGKKDEVWTEVSDFASSSETDRHYMLDAITGEIRFGPAMPQRDGSVRRYGAIPEKGALIIMKQYRYGGGIRGNLQVGAINTLKTSIPFIARVTNRQPAIGGLDAENIEDAKLRVPGHLRTLERAVTAKDFEYLAIKSAPGRVSRAFALPVAADTSSRVNVFIVPQITDPNRIIEREELVLADDVRQIIHNYLDERRLLTTNLDIMEPQYYWISTKVRFRPSTFANPEEVENAISARLYQYLNPIIGGPEGKGWPFGRDLVQSDIIAALQDINGIDFIRSIELYWIQYLPEGDINREGPLPVIETVQHGLIASYRHDVRAADA